MARTRKPNKNRVPSKPNKPSKGKGGLGGAAQSYKKNPVVEFPSPIQVRPPQPMQGNLADRARREIDMVYEPQLDAIDQGIRDTQNLGQQRQAAVGDVYSRLKNEMAGFGNTGDEYAQLAGQMQGFMGQLPTMQGQGSFGPIDPAAQAAAQASQAVTGSVGQAAQAGLAMQRGQSTGDTQHMKQTHAGDMATRRTNYLEQMYDTIQQLQEGRVDLLEDMPQQYEGRLDELRDQRFDQGLAAGQFGMNLAQQQGENDWRKQLIKMLRGELGGGGRGGGGYGPNPRANPNRGAPGGDSTTHAHAREGSAQGPPAAGRGPARPSFGELQGRLGNLNDMVRGWDEKYDFAEPTRYEQRDGKWYAVYENAPGAGGAPQYKPIEDLFPNQNASSAAARKLGRRKTVSKNVTRRGRTRGSKKAS